MVLNDCCGVWVSGGGDRTHATQSGWFSSFSHQNFQIQSFKLVEGISYCALFPPLSLPYLQFALRWSLCDQKNLNMEIIGVGVGDTQGACELVVDPNNSGMKNLYLFNGSLHKS
jgi:hypothetical protein